MTFLGRAGRIGVAAAAVGWATVGLPAAAHADGTGNLVVNGSFESPAVSSGYVIYPAGSTAIPGWTVGGTGANAGVEQDASNIWPADTGSVSVDLSGNAPGDLSQVVPTQVGSTYTLSYAMGGNFYCGQNVKTMRVTVGNDVFTQEFNDSVSSSSNMHWAHASIQVTASTATTRIDFADATPDASSCGATLDSVSLTQTPPPATPEAPATALLGGGAAVLFGGGWFLTRRRRARRA